MLSVERQARIERIVRQKQLVKVAELMEEFEVSDMTIRRDLGVLEKRGLIRKVYGGAVLAEPAVPLDQDENLDVRAAASSEYKQQIARLAVDLIEPGDVIILDAGTTTLEVARLIPNQKNLVVVTNSLSVAHELLHRSSSLLLAGGIVRPSTHSVVGPKTKEFFNDLRASKLFLGASSLSLDGGLMNSNLYESEIKRMMIAAADQVILVADASKFETKSYHVFAQWSEVDLFVTDRRLQEEIRRDLSHQGVGTLVAGEWGR